MRWFHANHNTAGTAMTAAMIYFHEMPAENSITAKIEINTSADPSSPCFMMIRTGTAP